MLFKLRQFKSSDIHDFVKIYNSNMAFIRSHLNVESIDLNWLESEILVMKKHGFKTIAIVNEKDVAIGLIDYYKDGLEVYLSLFMLDFKHQDNGIGRLAYEAFEKEYCNSCDSIKLDIVKEYDDRVEYFWKSNGYDFVENIELKWNGYKLDAKKYKKLFL